MNKKEIEELVNNFSCFFKNVLNLWDKNIGDDDIKSVIEKIHGDDDIDSIDLGDNKITGKGATALAEYLKYNRTIKSLKIHNNKIGDEGAVAFGEVLKTNTILEELDLSNNNISDYGMEAIADSLYQNEALKSLNLSSNHHIGKGSMCKLSLALSHTKKLRILDLSRNDVEDLGCCLLFSGIIENTSLKSIYLVDCKISKSLQNGLRRPLKFRKAGKLHIHFGFDYKGKK